MLINTHRGPLPQPGDAVPTPADGQQTPDASAQTPGAQGAVPAPGTPEFAELKAKRAEVKAAFERNRASDGAWGKTDAPSPSTKSKLTTNPYAHTPATLHRVATQVDAGPVLPPPGAHVKAISGPAAKAMARRMDLPSHPTTLGTAAAGLGVATPSAALISAALTDPNGLQKEAFTAEEAAQIKALVGRAPPAATLASAATETAPQTSTEALKGTPRTDATGTAQISDSYESLQHRATTFVPWQAFCISLSAKEMKALGEWLMLRQKVQYLAATVAVQMRKLDVQHEQFNIAMEQADKFRAFAQAYVNMQAMQNSGTKNRLINEGFHADPDTLDLSVNVKQDSNTSAVQDISRMAFIRQAAGERTTVTPLAGQGVTHAQDPFNGYASEKLQQNVHPNSAILLKAPGTTPGADILVERTLLTPTEVASLTDGGKETYSKAVADMKAQRHKDLPGMAALYDYEAGLCAAAAKRCATALQAPGLSPERVTQLTADQKGWTERAAHFRDEGRAHHTTLQTFSQAALRDENAFGDITRARRDWEGRRNAITAKLENKDITLPPEERIFLERKKLNFDLRATYLDREMGKYTNPSVDNRMNRWHTGAPSMAEGYIQNHLDIARTTVPGQPESDALRSANLRLATMRAIAPKGANACNDLHFKVIDAYRNQRQPALNAEDEAKLSTISRAQMLRHIADREQALASKPGLANGDALQKFLVDERAHLAQAKTFWQTRMQTDTNPGKNPLSKLAFSAARAVAPLHAAGRNPANIKNPTIDASGPQPMAAGTEVPDFLDKGATAQHFDHMAKAGGSVMGNTNDPTGHAYQNFMFERLNVLSQAANNADFSIMGNSATAAASGAAPDVAEEASQALAETYGLIAQERNAIQPMAEQLVNQAYQV